MRISFRTHHTTTNLGHILSRVRGYPSRDITVTRRFTNVTITLPTGQRVLRVHRHHHLRHLRRFFKNSTINRQRFTANGRRRITRLVFRFIRAFFRTPNGALLNNSQRFLLNRVANMRRHDKRQHTGLVDRQDGRTPRQERAFITYRLVLRVPNFNRIIRRRRLAKLNVRQTHNGQRTPAILRKSFVAIIFAKHRAANSSLTPRLTFRQRTRRFTHNQVNFTRRTLNVSSSRTTKWRVGRILRAINRTFLFHRLLRTLNTSRHRLTFGLNSPNFRRTMKVNRLTQRLIRRHRHLLGSRATHLLCKRQRPQDVESEERLNNLKRHTLSLN